MIIIPAIDLWESKVVRFTRGNPALSKVYFTDPIEAAKKWADAGAKLLHLVDLSAALGKGDNLEMIKAIIKENIIKVEVGGGIRSLEQAQELVSLGAQRVIIGTKSVDEHFLENIVNSLGRESVAVGVDVIDGIIAVEGWQKKTILSGMDFIRYLRSKRIKWIIYTDISRDGTLTGVNMQEINKAGEFSDMNFIVSGGVSSTDDLITIKKEAPFVWGVIIGKALYENKINLEKATALV